MEKSCDSFWKWGNARKKMAYTKDRCLEGVSCSMPDKASSVADGLSFKIHNGEGPLNIRQGMDGAFGPRSHMISSKLGGPCRVGSSIMESMEVNLSNSKNKNIEVNCKSSPTSVIGALISSSLQISSCDLNEKEPSELRVRKMDQKAGCGEGIRKRESSMEDIMYCSISEEADEDMQLPQWRINEETRNLKPMGGSVTMSSDMCSPCKKRKSCNSLLTNGTVKVQKENPESFAALNMLADVAVREFKNGYKKDDKATTSLGQWQIHHPSGAPSHKIVLKRAKNDSKSLSPELSAHAYKLSIS